MKAAFRSKKLETFIRYVIERSEEQLDLADESTRSMLEAFIEDGNKVLKETKMPRTID